MAKAVNKVIYGSQTIVDMTDATAGAGDIVVGKSAYLANGTKGTGTLDSKAAASGGTDLSLVTTGEKYTWNSKSNLALGETSSTAYRGDRGKTAYDHSQSTHARTDATAVTASSTNGNIKINGTETTVYTHPSGTNPHGTTKSDVGLGNVGNFKAVSTVASQGLTSTEQANARANIGAGTSSLTLGTSSTTAYRGDYGNTAYTHSQSDHSGIKPAFTQASSRANIATGESLATMFGKIKKFFADLKAVAFSGSYSDLSNRPKIISLSDVAITAGTGDIATITDSRITADHVVVGYNIVWGNPSAITSDVTVTTSAGSAVINGTCTSATTATFQLAIPE